MDRRLLLLLVHPKRMRPDSLRPHRRCFRKVPPTGQEDHLLLRWQAQSEQDLGLVLLRCYLYPLMVSWNARPVSPTLTNLSADGQEPGISNMLENLYLDNNRELQHDFGPKVHEGPVRRRNALRHNFGPRDGTRRTEATLVAHLTSHSDAITGLAVSPDHMFFVSASDDKTVKVWDTARLERNVTSKPRYTYNQHHARVKCVCMLEGVHCFASAADDGSMHVVRIHITQSGALPKYSKLQVIREHRVEHVGEYITSMAHYNTGM